MLLGSYLGSIKSRISLVGSCYQFKNIPQVDLMGTDILKPPVFLTVVTFSLKNMAESLPACSFLRCDERLLGDSEDVLFLY